MRSFFTLILIGGIIFLGCKKKTTQPEPKKNLDQGTAQAIAPSVAVGTGSMCKAFFNPESFVPQYLAKFGIFTPPCITVSGDTTDGDKDYYAKDATYTFNCEFQYPGYTIRLTGTVIVKDDDDSDPTSGFYMKIENLSYYESYGQQTTSWEIDALFDINRTGQNWGGHIEYAFTYNNISWKWAWDFTYVPDNPSDPWAGGTLNFEGAFTLNYQNTTYSLTARGENIHYSRNSNCDYPDSGTLTVTDGTNSLVVQFNCDSYTATYNGTPVASY